MRTPLRWTLTSQASLQLLCACCALLGAPAAAVAAPEQVTATTVVSTSPPIATHSNVHNSAARIAGRLFDKRVLTLLAMGYFIGMLIGWASGGPRDTRVRLFTKPKKASLSVLVSPGPAPRLIANDSPHATRARGARAQVSRQTPAIAAQPRAVTYFAAFADAPKEATEGSQVDYLLELDDGVADCLDLSGHEEDIDSGA